MQTWIIQRKIFKGDWETIASRTSTTKAIALDRYNHLNGKLRAVSETQAQNDYLAGRADNWQRKLAPEPEFISPAQFKQAYPVESNPELVAEMQAIAEMQFQDYLKREGTTEEQVLADALAWCDAQD